MEGEVVSIETAQVEGLQDSGEGAELLQTADAALMEGGVAPQEVTGNVEMMVMDTLDSTLDPALLQMKTEVLEGGGTVTVTGGDEGQIITLQVSVICEFTLRKVWKISFVSQTCRHKLFRELTGPDCVLTLGGEHGGQHGADECSAGAWTAAAGAGPCHYSHRGRTPGQLC